LKDSATKVKDLRLADNNIGAVGAMARTTSNTSNNQGDDPPKQPTTPNHQPSTNQCQDQGHQGQTCCGCCGCRVRVGVETPRGPGQCIESVNTANAKDGNNGNRVGLWPWSWRWRFLLGLGWSLAFILELFGGWVWWVAWVGWKQTSCVSEE